MTTDHSAEHARFDAIKHCELFLGRISRSVSVGRCITEGYDIFHRLDGRTLSAQDLDAISTFSFGQEQTVHYLPRRERAEVVVITWMCDASD